MKIAFDAQLLLDNNKTGIGWCAYHVVEQIKQLYPENSYTLNFFEVRREESKELKKRVAAEYTQKGFGTVTGKIQYTLYKMIWTFFPLPYDHFIKTDADITMFFNFYVPPGVKGKKVTIVHDMTYLAYPETVNKKTLFMLRMNMKRSCRRADKILTVSEFTKKELMKYLSVDEDKIEVMYNGVDFELYKQYDKELVRKAGQKYDLPEDYFLYLGTLEPRKNIVRMLEAYVMLKEERGDVPKFVFAGRKGWMYDEIFEKVKEYGIEEDVIFTGYVEQEDSPLLMNGAKAFVFVSLYEGFGMPVLEAMACGVPVVTADAASLPEVVGDCGILANPFSVESIKDGLARAISGGTDIENMTKRALERSRMFTWEKSAKKVMDVFESIM